MPKFKKGKNSLDKRRIFVTILAFLMIISMLFPLFGTVFLRARAVTQAELKSQIAGLKGSVSDSAAKKKELEAKLSAIKNDKAKAMERRSLLAEQGEGSLAAAVKEMTEGYDQLMKPVIDNIPVLIVVLVLTIPVAILAMRLAERTLKKPAATLK